MILGKDNIWRLPPPVGASDWATFSRDSHYVDKTPLACGKDRIELMSDELPTCGALR